MKDWKSLDDQLALVKYRGMAISDPVRAQKALERFGYYRLSGHILYRYLMLSIASCFTSSEIPPE
jgi:abortive infection bacteriophage resistance protein